ncbi:MAG: hypothetical protein QOE99_263 [Actinomycetota bacterium]|jgi:hypothetical protein|nr:hypothetical protein [Actinomycetota bacterium]
MDDFETELTVLVGAGPVLMLRPAVTAALDELAAAVPHRRRGRARRRTAVVAVVAAAGIVGGTAAAGVYTTHTGRSQVEYGTNTGEVLDTRAPDFASAARATLPGLPLPPGQSWQPYADRLITAWQTSEGTLGGIATKSVNQAWAVHAWCAWAKDWYAEPRPDSEAAGMLRQAPTWKDLAIYRHDGVGNSVYQLADAVKTSDTDLANKALLGWIEVPGSQVPARNLGCNGFGE